MDSAEDADLHEIRKYFSRKEWDELSKYEKLRYLNVKRNYDLLIASGFSSEYVPDFMEKYTNKNKKKKTTVKKSYGSDNENDNGWLPDSSTRKYRSTKKKIPKELKEDDSNKTKKKSERKLTNTSNNIKPNKKPKVLYNSPLKDQTNNTIDKQVKVYSLRNASTKKTYTEDNTDCVQCEKVYFEICPVHGLAHVIPNKTVREYEENNAECGVPRGLSIGPSKIKGAKNGVWADTCFPKGAHFGPYQEKHDNEEAKVKTEEKNDSYHIDSIDTKETNWMSYINHAKNEFDQNVEAYQYNGKIYYKVIKSIYPGTELLMWRRKEHAKQPGMKPLEKQNEEGGNSYECTVCKEKFNSLIILEIHKEIHPTKLNRKHQCSRCEYSTDIKEKLKRHFNIHTGEKPFVCSRCNRAFVWKDNLKKHETLVHFKNGNYECSVCGRRFVAKKSLGEHSVIHTKDKPFECNICEKHFTTGSALRRHVKSVHLNIRLHQCSICKKRFSEKGNLKTHTLKIHTKEGKPSSVETSEGKMNLK